MRNLHSDKSLPVMLCSIHLIKKFGGYSIYNSDATTGSAFELPYSFINYLTSDFTIDFWVKPWQEIPENL